MKLFAYLALAIASLQNVGSAPVSDEIQFPGPLFPYLNPNAPPGRCLGNDFDTAEKRQTIWVRSYAGVIANFYLQQNNYTYWEQEMYKILFPDEPSGTFDCLTQASHCDLNGKSCQIFDNMSEAGTFYVFQSLSNIHVFFSQYLLELNWLMGNLTLNIPILAHEWGADKTSDQSLNIFAIIGGALGMASAASAAVPEVSGPLGALSAFSSLISNTIAKPDAGNYHLGEVEANLANLVLDACGGWRDQVNKISDAIYGAPGADPSNIPSSMQKPAQDVSHPSVLVMSDGQWLLDHPTEALASDFATVEKQMQQALAWQLLRVLHNVYVVINDGVTNADDCSKDGNSVWDPDHNWCWGLMNLSDDGILLGGTNDLTFSLWDPAKYGMDKLSTYRNVYDCWVSDPPGNLKSVSVNTDPLDFSLPKCFFGMEIRKGTWYDYGPKDRGILLDNANFPNFNDGQTKEDWWPFDPTPCENCFGT